MKIWKHVIPLLLLLAGFAPAVGAAPRSFFLKNGDRVCFYGDSITEQRFYPAEVQTYVLTRFPNLHVRFVDAGVGGDKVGGGWAGPINLRLKRDVFSFKPNVVTIMLGMNDAGYQPFNQTLFNVYRRGYQHIISSLRKHLPGVRIVVIVPSPFDDVTFKPGFPLHLPWTHPGTAKRNDSHGGYNDVLLRYGAFVRRLAVRDHLLCVDFNTPMVHVLAKIDKVNKNLARQVIPGRVHPGAAAQMMMAQALLRAWDAPATVTGLSINAARDRVTHAVNTRLTDLKATGGGLSWTELDGSLPMPVLGLHENWPQFPIYADYFLPPQPNPKYTNPVAALIDRFSGFTHQLDREMLTVKALTASRYRLLIDGKPVGEFSARQLAHGVNLSRYFTPMLWQAYQVSNIVWEEIQTHFVAWHGVQTPLEDFGFHLPVSTENDPAVARAVRRVVKDMGRIQSAISAREYRADQPRPHHFQLVPARH